MDKIISRWSNQKAGILTTTVIGFFLLSLRVVAQPTQTSIAGTWLTYDARSRITYSYYLILQADKSLKAHGFMGISLFGKSTPGQKQIKS